ncbi:MAG: aspartate-semialdehyde dehydrogenase [Kiritimatiellia bacterium]|jgi:aspartate-semialdehyde dehydrogenase
MKQYRVGIVGIGAVGAEMVRVLWQRKFPAAEIKIIARSARTEEIDGESYPVVAAAPEAFDNLDFAFFAGTEGTKGASQQFGWMAVEKGVIVIDNGDDYRMDSRVPLVIPEINPDALAQHQGFIANPNCSTTIALMAVAPLYRAARVRRFVVSTYQAVSGTGRQAIMELEQQIRDFAAGNPLQREVYPHQIALNLIPKIGSVKPGAAGQTSEEAKMLHESRKILGDKKLRVSATCVRVPVLNAHCEAINLEFDRPMEPEEAREILSNAPGVIVMDDVDHDDYPMPLLASGRDEIIVGRIRRDDSVKNGLALFVAGDNIRKGAATNAVQIAEKLIEMKG